MLATEIIDMKILITGGLGFIGTNFVNSLLESKFYDFTIVDSQVNSFGINKLAEDKTYNFDIIETDRLSDLSRDCTHIVHLAGLGSVPRSIENPNDTFRSNVLGTQSVLECARKNNIKVIFASSSSVFGNQGNHVRNEKSERNPISPYGYSKYIDELLINSYFETFGVKSYILRFFNVFGPFQTVKNEYAAVIPKILEAVKKDEVFEIHGDGEQSRDFTYVGDVVSIIREILKDSDTGTNILNLAWGRKTTLNQIIEIIQVDLGLNLKYINTKSRNGDIKNSQNDGIKISDLYPLIKPTDFKKAIKFTSDWYLNQKL